MKVQISRADAIAARSVAQELRGERTPELLRELGDAIDNAEGDSVSVSAEVVQMAYLRLLAYSHSQSNTGRWSRYKMASDRIYDALRESGVDT